MTESSRVERIQHTHIGGQAVLEGIMMRGKRNWAIAVRMPDGQIHLEEHDLKTAVTEHPWLGKPIIRGVWGFYETIVLAMKAFEISASFAGETEEEQLTSKEISMAMVFGVVLSVLLFIVAPALLTNWFVGPANEQPFMWNLVDGILRLVAFFLYIWGVSRIEDIQRVFAYHGAEHKTIHAYEHGLPLEASVIQKYTTMHVRCGTSFLLMVMVVALLVYSLIPVKTIVAGFGWDARWATLLVAIAIRIIFLPLIAGLAYEVVKWAGNAPENPLVRVLLWPGLQMQRMTTREPDDSMIEIAVAAMKAVVAREARGTAPAIEPDTVESEIAAPAEEPDAVEPPAGEPDAIEPPAEHAAG